MTKPSASKLIPTVPGALTPKVAAVASRRAQYSASTKRALIEVAQDLFTEQGYAATSLDQIVAGARVTKGALYHHFSGKRALFEAVFQQIEAAADHEIRQGLKGERDPWLKAQAGLRAFLEVVQQPGYRRIVIQDGPSVLGFERFRDQEERSTFATVNQIVRDFLSAGIWEPDEDMLQTFARVFFGALSSAGHSVAASSDPAIAARRVEAAIGFILTGLQALEQAGVELPDPTAADD